MNDQNVPVYIGEMERAVVADFIAVTTDDMDDFRQSRVWLALHHRWRAAMQMFESRALSIHTTQCDRTYYAAQLATMRQVLASLNEIAVVDEIPDSQMDVEIELRDQLKGVL